MHWLWSNSVICEWTVTAGRGSECDAVSELWQVEAVNVTLSVTLSVNCDRSRLWVWHCVWTVTGRGSECDAVSELWQQVEAMSVTLCVNRDRSRLWMWRCQWTVTAGGGCECDSVSELWQVEALNVTLSDNSLSLMESQQRVSQLQRLVTASEHERTQLQQRLDSSRSDNVSVTVICFDTQE